MIPRAWLDDAAARIKPWINQTPLTYDADLNTYYKWENQQITGSFKVRGALNKVLSLEAWERQRGLVTASAGNHGQGVAFAAKITGAKAVVFASEHAVPKKLAAMEALGAQVRLVPGGYLEAELAAIVYASQNSMIWISPYNDGQVIAGQGTIGLELAMQVDLSSIRTILVPAGSGGLVSGIGASLQLLDSKPELWAVQSDASPFLHAYYTHGNIDGVEEFPSLADGLAGGLEPGSMTIPLIKHYVDRFFLVKEEDIGKSIAYAWEQYGETIEGSGAVPLAAVLSGEHISKPALIVVSGGNIQPEIHRELCKRYQAHSKEASL